MWNSAAFIDVDSSFILHQILWCSMMFHAFMTCLSPFLLQVFAANSENCTPHVFLQCRRQSAVFTTYAVEGQLPPIGEAVTWTSIKQLRKVRKLVQFAFLQVLINTVNVCAAGVIVVDWTCQESIPIDHNRSCFSFFVRPGKMIFSEIMRSLVENLEAWKVESRELPILHRFSEDISRDDVWFLSVQVPKVAPVCPPMNLWVF